MALLEKHAGHNIEIIEHLEKTHYAHYYCNTCKKFVTWCSMHTLVETRYREKYLKDRKYYSFDLDIKYEEKLPIKKMFKGIDWDTYTKKWFVDIRTFNQWAPELQKKLLPYTDGKSMTDWLANYADIFDTEYVDVNYRYHPDVYAKYQIYLVGSPPCEYPQRELTPEEQFWKNQWDKYNGYQ